MRLAAQCAWLALVACLVITPSPSGAAGVVHGRVSDQDTGEPVPGAVVVIDGTRLGAWTDDAGAFRIEGAAADSIVLVVTHVGYAAIRRPVKVPDGGSVEVILLLTPEVIALKAMTVTPSRFAIMGSEPQTRQTLTEEQIQTIPHFGEDIYRAVTRLPGITGSDYSAKFTVRGGEHDEVLVLLDGVQLYEPFHLKDIDGGALSAVDVEAIEGIDLLTGGFPVEYGDRTSGVFNIRSRTPEPGHRRSSVGLSFMNARAMTEGTFAGGSWLVSARRGYLDMVLWLMGEDEQVDPRYYDVLAKVEYQASPRHRLSGHVLHARDLLELVEDDADASETGYGNSYAWLNATSVLSPRLTARTTLSVGRVTSDRDGDGLMDDQVTPDFDIRDRRHFVSGGLRQDWDWEVSERHYLKGGFDVKGLSAEYDYLSRDTDVFGVGDSVAWRTDTTSVYSRPGGHTVGVYAAERLRLAQRLTAEVGLRYDRASHTGDDLLSPRLSVALAPREGTSLRASWGLYRQSQGLHEMAVQDGERLFHAAERCEHRVVSLERQLDAATQVRVEAYWKGLSSQRPVYRNIHHDIELFPELIDDRVRLDVERTRARGLEFYARRDHGGRLTWWASYGWARVREQVAAVESQDGRLALDRSLPGPYDQRHTLYLDVNCRPSPRWHLNLAWQYRSGWPYTDVVLRHQAGPQGVRYWSEWGSPQGARLPPFHRLDLRLSRRFRTAGGEVAAYLEVINAYDRGNVSAYSYTWARDDRGGYYLEKEPDYYFRLLPSLGVNWSWGR